MSRRRAIIWFSAIATMTAFAMTGCAGGEPSPAEESRGAESTSTRSPGAESPSNETPPRTKPSAERLAIPDCETLVPIERVHDIAGEDFVYLPDAQNLADFYLDTRGPAAGTAIEAATDRVICSWGIPQTDALNTVMVAAVPDPAQGDFLDALRKSDFAESSIDGAPVFTWKQEPTIGPSVNWYAFEGDFVIGGLVSNESGELAAVALDTMRRLAE